jgi:hypothetical protein
VFQPLTLPGLTDEAVRKGNHADGVNVHKEQGKSDVSLDSREKTVLEPIVMIQLNRD